MIPLRALIFDFDGLIVDTESAVLDAWQSVHAEDGRNGDPAVLHALVGTVGVSADLWTAYPVDQDRAALEERLTHRARVNCRAAPVLPGVLRLWDEAHAAGLKLAVASNSSHPHVDGHLSTRGLTARFATVVCREDVPRGKPAPDLYLAALDRLGVRAEEAVAFEDSVPGHEAAARAGLRVVVVPNPLTRHAAFPHAALRISSLSDLDLAQLEQLTLPQSLASLRV